MCWCFIHYWIEKCTVKQWNTEKVFEMLWHYHQSVILRQGSRDVELKKFCVTLLETFGSVKYTRHTLENLDAEMRAEIAKLGGNPMLEDVLDELLDWKRETSEIDPENWGSCVIKSNFSSFYVWLVANSYLFIFCFLKEEKILRNVCVWNCAAWALFIFPTPWLIIILF